MLLFKSDAFANPFAGIEFEWKSEIGVFNFSPVLAYQISERISVDAAMNIYYGMMQLKRAEDMMDVVTNPGVPQQGEDGMVDTQTAFDIKGLGYGATISLKWKCLLTDKLDWGLSYRTPINVNFSGDANMGVTYDADLDIEWHAWYGFGAAFTPCEMMTFTLDAQYSNWKTLEMLTANIYEVPGMPNPYKKDMHLDWEDAVQIRFGVERKLNECLAARLGYYYDPAPAPDETLNILFPSSTNHVITTGFGWEKGKFNVDFGLEYLLGGEREISNQAQTEHNMAGTHQMDILAFSLGLGYKFGCEK